MLMLEGATEDDVLHDMQRLEPALMALVEDGLLASRHIAESLLPRSTCPDRDPAAPLRTKDPDVLLQVVTTSLVEAGFDLIALPGLISTRSPMPCVFRYLSTLPPSPPWASGNCCVRCWHTTTTAPVAQALLFPTNEAMDPGPIGTSCPSVSPPS